MENSISTSELTSNSASTSNSTSNSTAPKTVVVTPTVSKPIDVHPAPIKVAEPTPQEGGEKAMDKKDPKGMFDYSNCETYTVKAGDTLLDIALKYHIALQQLRYFNHLDKVTFKIDDGQILFIPAEPVYVPAGK